VSYVIIVDFRLKPGQAPAFRKLIEANARASCANEPGCQRFDVLEPASEPDRVVLYEIYDDRQAFDAHCRSEHFALFDKASASMVDQKSVKEFKMICEGSQATTAMGRAHG
jgi:(4S)-4-hydroxy-5-phosphonooxypentane-2,3-dione isomerase